jgi:hypothetical protein
MPIGPEAGVSLSANVRSISSMRSNGVADLAVELVDESDDRYVAQAVDLEELPRFLLSSSIPFSSSKTIIALSTGASVQKISPLTSRWPGVSSRLKAGLPRSELIAAERCHARGRLLSDQTASVQLLR